jgi:tetrathionate reductase subunit C
MASIVEIINVTRDAPWEPWAVQYFFLIGLSYGALALTMPGIVLGRKAWEKASRAALLAALVSGFSAPVALLSDLHSPGRFMNFYLHPQPHSWMSWGSFFLIGYTLLLPLYTWAVVAPDLRAAAAEGGPLALPRRLLGGAARPRLVRALGVLTLGAAALVALYTGMETMIVRARPLWNTPLLPVLLLTTAFAGAIGLTLLLERFACGNDRASEVLLNRWLARTLVVVAALAVSWWLRALGGGESEATVLAQIQGFPLWRGNLVWGVVALAAPFLVSALKPGGSGWLTGVLALHLAWAFRWILIIDGQDIPKTGAGMYRSVIAAGPEGWTGMIGTAGLCLLILIVLTAFIPWSGASRSGTAAVAGGSR